METVMEEVAAAAVEMEEMTAAAEMEVVQAVAESAVGDLEEVAAA